MYAAAGGASLAGRKARQHGRQPAPGSPSAHSPPHPAPTGVRAYSCQHWESRLAAPPRPASAAPSDLAECAAGRAAWQEAAAISVGAGGVGAGGAARRCSVLGDHPGARRDQKGKWIRNNRVRDASYGSSSESDGEPEGAAGEPWGVARLLYAGLGTLALGLVVYFVGTGDKGFKTPALRMVGPSLCAAGLGCCLIRICFCIFAKPCFKRRTNFKENRRLSGGASGEEMPLAGGPRCGPAQCSPARRLDTSSCDVSSLSSGEEDERLRRYRIASGRPELWQASSPHTTAPASSGLASSAPSSSQAPGSAQKPLLPLPVAHRSKSPDPDISLSPIPHISLSPTPHISQSPIPHISQAPVPHISQSPIPHISQSPAPVSAPCDAHAAPSTSATVSTVDVDLPGSSAVDGGNVCAPAAGSSLHRVGHRRPPPRNVSFASGPEGELVLSPAQLRS